VSFQGIVAIIKDSGKPWRGNMRSLLFSVLTIVASSAFAESAGLQVDVALSPAGSFKARTAAVTGSAYKTADGVAAENVTINMRELTTGISLRDKHMKDHLKVKDFPQARLIKATGSNGKGEAVLQIKGKKHTVQGTYKIQGQLLHAEFKLNLPSLDISGIKYMGAGVKDDVLVKVDLPLKSKRASASGDD